MAKITHDGCGGDVHALYMRVNGANGRRTWVRFGSACVRCHTLMQRLDGTGAPYNLDALKEHTRTRLSTPHTHRGADG